MFAQKGGDTSLSPGTDQQMSILLYRLGRVIGRRRGLVVSGGHAELLVKAAAVLLVWAAGSACALVAAVKRRSRVEPVTSLSGST